MSEVQDLNHILEKVGTTNKFCVEFGVQNGINEVTSHLVHKENWSAFYIEGNPQRCEEISLNCTGKNVTLIQSWITAENINDLFAQGNVPAEPDVVSIDIDGMDYWIWKSLNYNPRVLFIEYNSTKVPPELAVVAYNPSWVWNETRWFGASLQSLVNLGKDKGYELVGTTDIGTTAYFVRSDLYDLMGIMDNSPSKLFNYAGYGMGPDGGHRFPDGDYLKI